MVHLSQVTDGVFEGLDAWVLLLVVLLSQLVERIDDLEVSELSVTIQELISVFLSCLDKPLNDVAEYAAHISQLLCDVLLGLETEDAGVEELGRNGIDLLIELGLRDLLLTSLLVLSHLPEWETQVHGIVQMHYHILIKLELDYEPFKL